VYFGFAYIPSAAGQNGARVPGSWGPSINQVSFEVGPRRDGAQEHAFIGQRGDNCSIYTVLGQGALLAAGGLVWGRVLGCPETFLGDRGQPVHASSSQSSLVYFHSQRHLNHIFLQTF